MSGLGTDGGAYSAYQLQKLPILLFIQRITAMEEFLKQQLQKGFPRTMRPIGEAKPEGIHDSWLLGMMGGAICLCCPTSQADRWIMCDVNSSGSP